jgi:sucrose phosphorylase
MTAQAIMLSLVGVPGIYFHSLFGSRGWRAGVDRTGRNRTINRQKFDLTTFEKELANPASVRHRVFLRYVQLLRARSASSAFHPHGSQEVLDCGDTIFALLRHSPDGSQHVLCLYNVSDQLQSVMVKENKQPVDLFTNEPLGNSLDDVLILKPYQTLWLRMTE